MTFIVATNVIASRPPERRPTGTPNARANYLVRFCFCSAWPRLNLISPGEGGNRKKAFGMSLRAVDWQRR